MLSSERIMNVDTPARYVWNNTDWDKIGAELQRLHADWRTREFTMSEFEDAMETVITQEHQRTFMSMEDVTPHLFMAFARRTPGSENAPSPKVKTTVAAPVNSVGAIRWSPEEWEQVVLEMHRIAPTMFELRCKNLASKDIRTAQMVLDLHRRREPNQLEIYRKQLLKTWDSLPADVKDVRLQDRKIVDFPSGPVMQPPKQKSDNSSAIALAMHKGFQAPEKVKQPVKPITLGKVKQKRNHYDDADWLNIAREMHRQNPFAPYFTSAFQTVDLPALRAAQREVIPFERRRTIAGNYGLAKPLVAAFAALKLEIDAQKPHAEPADLTSLTAELSKYEIQDSSAKQEQAPQIGIAPAAPVQQVAAQVAPQYVLTKSGKEIHPPTDFLSRIAQASKPLIGVLVDEFRNDIAQEVAKILLPQITGALAPMLDSALQGVKDAIAAQFNPWSTSGLAQSALPIATPDYAHGATALSSSVIQEKAPISPTIAIDTSVTPVHIPVNIPVAKPVEKPKKTKIAVIGPRGGQQEQVIRAFPEFEFVFIENGHGIKEAGTSCALFVCANAYLNRANRDNIKTHVSPEKVRYIDGGMSTIKRTINVWKATQKA